MRLDDPVEQILIDVHRHFHAILGMAFRRDAQGIFKNLLISDPLKIRRCGPHRPTGERCGRDAQAPLNNQHLLRSTIFLCVPWRPLRLGGKSLFKDSALRAASPYRVAVPDRHFT
jgi:hypothetical protein